jgi:SAM-dependent methyltransferase
VTATDTLHSRSAIGRVCPTCLHPVARPLGRYATARLVRCRGCGLVFASDLPSGEELHEHYADYPACGQLSPLTSKRYGEVLDRLEAFRDTGRLLDVGCGDGHFLVAARDRGWIVCGSEYGDGPRRRAQALGLDVRSAPFSAVDGERASFDVVTAIEVLEHFSSPLEEVARIFALLRGGGCLYLTTPNFNSLSRRLLGPRWRAVDYPEHLNLFTPRTLEAFLTRAGFQRLFIRTTGISPSDLAAGIKSIGKQQSFDASPPAFDDQVRAALNESTLLEHAARIANVALSALRIGDTIKAIYLRS